MDPGPDLVVAPALLAHVRAFFSGHAVEEIEGRAPADLPAVRALRIAPGPAGELWLYLSAGATDFDPEIGEAAEFLLASPVRADRLTEILAIAAHHHREGALDEGHTFPLGEGWLPGSSCDHILVSLPYPFGPELEICPLPDGRAVQVLWLLPITEAEKDYRHREGLEALESRFEETEMAFADPARPSVA
jgi:hypothetical protein